MSDREIYKTRPQSSRRTYVEGDRALIAVGWGVGEKLPALAPHQEPPIELVLDYWMFLSLLKQLAKAAHAALRGQSTARVRIGIWPGEPR